MGSRTLLTAVAILAIAATADAGPSFSKRIARLERQMRLVTQLSVSTSDQVDALQANAGITIRPVQASFPTGSGDTAGNASGDADCPPGYLATGGGAALQDSRAGDHIVFSEPHVIGGRPVGWSAAAVTYDHRNNTLLVDAICVKQP